MPFRTLACLRNLATTIFAFSCLCIALLRFWTLVLRPNMKGGAVPDFALGPERLPSLAGLAVKTLPKVSSAAAPQVCKRGFVVSRGLS